VELSAEGKKTIFEDIKDWGIYRRAVESVKEFSARELEPTKLADLPLSPEDRELLSAYERSMLNNFEIWMKAYPKVSSQTDPVYRAQMGLELTKLRNDTCDNYSKICSFLRGIGIEPDRYYPHISFMCKQKLQD
jgi:hypothetical protein